MTSRDSGLSSFTIPRRRPSRTESYEVDVSLRECNYIQQLCRLSYLDTTYQGNWNLEKATLVTNAALEAQYKAKRRSIQTLHSHETYAFSCYDSKEAVLQVVKDGLIARQSHFNYLGDSVKGVNVCRHADVQLKVAEGLGQAEIWVVMFKIMLGRRKHVPIRMSVPPLDPTPQYDSHIPQQEPNVDLALDKQAIRSQAFLYEYGPDFLPVRRPRQVLPYSVLYYTHAHRQRPAQVTAAVPVTHGLNVSPSHATRLSPGHLAQRLSGGPDNYPRQRRPSGTQENVSAAVPTGHHPWQRRSSGTGQNVPAGVPHDPRQRRLSGTQDNSIPQHDPRRRRPSGGQENTVPISVLQTGHYPRERRPSGTQENVPGGVPTGQHPWQRQSSGTGQNVPAGGPLDPRHRRPSGTQENCASTVVSRTGNQRRQSASHESVVGAGPLQTVSPHGQGLGPHNRTLQDSHSDQSHAHHDSRSQNTQPPPHSPTSQDRSVTEQPQVSLDKQTHSQGHSNQQSQSPKTQDTQGADRKKKQSENKRRKRQRQRQRSRIKGLEGKQTAGGTVSQGKDPDTSQGQGGKDKDLQAQGPQVDTPVTAPESVLPTSSTRRPLLPTPTTVPVATAPAPAPVPLMSIQTRASEELLRTSTLTSNSNDYCNEMSDFSNTAFYTDIAGRVKSRRRKSAFHGYGYGSVYDTFQSEQTSGSANQDDQTSGSANQSSAPTSGSANHNLSDSASRVGDGDPAETSKGSTKKAEANSRRSSPARTNDIDISTSQSTAKPGNKSLPKPTAVSTSSQNKRSSFTAKESSTTNTGSSPLKLRPRFRPTPVKHRPRSVSHDASESDGELPDMLPVVAPPDLPITPRLKGKTKKTKKPPQAAKISTEYTKERTGTCHTKDGRVLNTFHSCGKRLAIVQEVPVIRVSDSGEIEVVMTQLLKCIKSRLMDITAKTPEKKAAQGRVTKVRKKKGLFNTRRKVKKKKTPATVPTVVEELSQDGQEALREYRDSPCSPPPEEITHGNDMTPDGASIPALPTSGEENGFMSLRIESVCSLAADNATPSAGDGVSAALAPTAWDAEQPPVTSQPAPDSDKDPALRAPEAATATDHAVDTQHAQASQGFTVEEMFAAANNSTDNTEAVAQNLDDRPVETQGSEGFTVDEMFAQSSAHAGSPEVLLKESTTTSVHVPYVPQESSAKVPSPELYVPQEVPTVDAQGPDKPSPEISRPDILTATVPSQKEAELETAEAPDVTSPTPAIPAAATAIDTQDATTAIVSQDEDVVESVEPRVAATVLQQNEIVEHAEDAQLAPARKDLSSDGSTELGAILSDAPVSDELLQVEKTPEEALISSVTSDEVPSEHAEHTETLTEKPTNDKSAETRGVSQDRELLGETCLNVKPMKATPSRPMKITLKTAIKDTPPRSEAKKMAPDKTVVEPLVEEAPVDVSVNKDLVTDPSFWENLSSMRDQQSPEKVPHADLDMGINKELVSDPSFWENLSSMRDQQSPEKAPSEPEQPAQPSTQPKVSSDSREEGEVSDEEIDVGLDEAFPVEKENSASAAEGHAIPVVQKNRYKMSAPAQYPSANPWAAASREFTGPLFGAHVNIEGQMAVNFPENIKASTGYPSGWQQVPRVVSNKDLSGSDSDREHKKMDRHVRNYRKKQTSASESERDSDAVVSGRRCSVSPSSDREPPRRKSLTGRSLVPGGCDRHRRKERTSISPSSDRDSDRHGRKDRGTISPNEDVGRKEKNSISPSSDRDADSHRRKASVSPAGGHRRKERGRSISPTSDRDADGHHHHRHRNLDREDEESRRRKRVKKQRRRQRSIQPDDLEDQQAGKKRISFSEYKKRKSDRSEKVCRRSRERRSIKKRKREAMQRQLDEELQELERERVVILEDLKRIRETSVAPSVPRSLEKTDPRLERRKIDSVFSSLEKDVQDSFDFTKLQSMGHRLSLLKEMQAAPGSEKVSDVLNILQSVRESLGSRPDTTAGSELNLEDTPETEDDSETEFVNVGEGELVDGEVVTEIDLEEIMRAEEEEEEEGLDLGAEEHPAKESEDMHGPSSNESEEDYYKEMEEAIGIQVDAEDVLSKEIEEAISIQAVAEDVLKKTSVGVDLDDLKAILATAKSQETPPKAMAGTGTWDQDTDEENPPNSAQKVIAVARGGTSAGEPGTGVEMARQTVVQSAALDVDSRTLQQILNTVKSLDVGKAVPQSPCMVPPPQSNNGESLGVLPMSELPKTIPPPSIPTPLMAEPPRPQRVIGIHQDPWPQPSMEPQPYHHNPMGAVPQSIEQSLLAPMDQGFHPGGFPNPPQPGPQHFPHGPPPPQFIPWGIKLIPIECPSRKFSNMPRDPHYWEKLHLHKADPRLARLPEKINQLKAIQATYHQRRHSASSPSRSPRSGHASGDHRTEAEDKDKQRSHPADPRLARRPSAGLSPSRAQSLGAQEMEADHQKRDVKAVGGMLSVEVSVPSERRKSVEPAPTQNKDVEESQEDLGCLVVDTCAESGSREISIPQTSTSPSPVKAVQKQKAKSARVGRDWASLIGGWQELNRNEDVVLADGRVKLGNYDPNVLQLILNFKQLSRSMQLSVEDRVCYFLSMTTHKIKQEQVYGDPTEVIPHQDRMRLMFSTTINQDVARELRILHELEKVEFALETDQIQLAHMPPVRALISPVDRDNYERLEEWVHMHKVRIEMLHRDLEGLKRYHKSQFVEALPDDFRLAEEKGRFISVEGSLLLMTSRLTIEDCETLLAMKRQIDINNANMKKTSSKDRNVRQKIQFSLGYLHHERKELMDTLCCSSSKQRDQLQEKSITTLAWYRTLQAELEYKASSDTTANEMLQYVLGRIDHLELNLTGLRSVQVTKTMTCNRVWTPRDNLQSDNSSSRPVTLPNMPTASAVTDTAKLHTQPGSPAVARVKPTLLVTVGESNDTAPAGEVETTGKTGKTAPSGEGLGTWPNRAVPGSASPEQQTLHDWPEHSNSKAGTSEKDDESNERPQESQEEPSAVVPEEVDHTDKVWSDAVSMLMSLKSKITETGTTGGPGPSTVPDLGREPDLGGTNISSESLALSMLHYIKSRVAGDPKLKERDATEPGVSTIETKDMMKDETKDETNDDTKDETNDEAIDETKDETKDEAKDETDETKDKTKDEAKDGTDETTDVAKDETTNETKVETRIGSGDQKDAEAQALPQELTSLSNDEVSTDQSQPDSHAGQDARATAVNTAAAAAATLPTVIPRTVATDSEAPTEKAEPSMTDIESGTGVKQITKTGARMETGEPEVDLSSNTSVVQEKEDNLSDSWWEEPLPLMMDLGLDISSSEEETVEDPAVKPASSVESSATGGVRDQRTDDMIQVSVEKKTEHSTQEQSVFSAMKRDLENQGKEKTESSEITADLSAGGSKDGVAVEDGSRESLLAGRSAPSRQEITEKSADREDAEITDLESPVQENVPKPAPMVLKESESLAELKTSAQKTSARRDDSSERYGQKSHHRHKDYKQQIKTTEAKDVSGKSEESRHLSADTSTQGRVPAKVVAECADRECSEICKPATKPAAELPCVKVLKVSSKRRSSSKDASSKKDVAEGSSVTQHKASDAPKDAKQTTATPVESKGVAVVKASARRRSSSTDSSSSLKTGGSVKREDAKKMQHDGKPIKSGHNSRKKMPEHHSKHPGLSKDAPKDPSHKESAKTTAESKDVTALKVSAKRRSSSTDSSSSLRKESLKESTKKHGDKRTHSADGSQKSEVVQDGKHISKTTAESKDVTALKLSAKRRSSSTDSSSSVKREPDKDLAVGSPKTAEYSGPKLPTDSKAVAALKASSKKRSSSMDAAVFLQKGSSSNLGEIQKKGTTHTAAQQIKRRTMSTDSSKKENPKLQSKKDAQPTSAGDFQKAPQEKPATKMSTKSKDVHPPSISSSSSKKEANKVDEPARKKEVAKPRSLSADGMEKHVTKQQDSKSKQAEHPTKIMQAKDGKGGTKRDVAKRRLSVGEIATTSETKGDVSSESPKKKFKPDAEHHKPTSDPRKPLTVPVKPADIVSPPVKKIKPSTQLTKHAVHKKTPVIVLSRDAAVEEAVRREKMAKKAAMRAKAAAAAAEPSSSTTEDEAGLSRLPKITKKSKVKAAEQSGTLFETISSADEDGPRIGKLSKIKKKVKPDAQQPSTYPFFEPISSADEDGPRISKLSKIKKKVKADPQKSNAPPLFSTDEEDAAIRRLPRIKKKVKTDEKRMEVMPMFENISSTDDDEPLLNLPTKASKKVVGHPEKVKRKRIRVMEDSDDSSGDELPEEKPSTPHFQTIRFKKTLSKAVLKPNIKPAASSSDAGISKEVSLLQKKKLQITKRLHNPTPVGAEVGIIAHKSSMLKEKMLKAKKIAQSLQRKQASPKKTSPVKLSQSAPSASTSKTLGSDVTQGKKEDARPKKGMAESVPEKSAPTKLGTKSQKKEVGASIPAQPSQKQQRLEAENSEESSKQKTTKSEKPMSGKVRTKSLPKEVEPCISAHSSEKQRSLHEGLEPTLKSDNASKQNTTQSAVSKSATSQQKKLSTAYKVPRLKEHQRRPSTEKVVSTKGSEDVSQKKQVPPKASAVIPSLPKDRREVVLVHEKPTVEPMVTEVSDDQPGVPEPKMSKAVHQSETTRPRPSSAAIPPNSTKEISSSTTMAVDTKRLGKKRRMTDSIDPSGLALQKNKTDECLKPSASGSDPVVDFILLDTTGDSSDASPVKKQAVKQQAKSEASKQPSSAAAVGGAKSAQGKRPVPSQKPSVPAAQTTKSIQEQSLPEATQQKGQGAPGMTSAVEKLRSDVSTEQQPPEATQQKGHGTATTSASAQIKDHVETSAVDRPRPRHVPRQFDGSKSRSGSPAVHSRSGSPSQDWGSYRPPRREGQHRSRSPHERDWSPFDRDGHHTMWDGRRDYPDRDRGSGSPADYNQFHGPKGRLADIRGAGERSRTSSPMRHQMGVREWSGERTSPMRHQRGEREWSGERTYPVRHQRGDREWSGDRTSPVRHQRGEREWSGDRRSCERSQREHRDLKQVRTHTDSHDRSLTRGHSSSRDRSEGHWEGQGHSDRRHHQEERGGRDDRGHWKIKEERPWGDESRADHSPDKRHKDYWPERYKREGKGQGQGQREGKGHWEGRGQREGKGRWEERGHWEPGHRDHWTDRGQREDRGHWEDQGQEGRGHPSQQVEELIEAAFVSGVLSSVAEHEQAQAAATDIDERLSAERVLEGNWQEGNTGRENWDQDAPPMDLRHTLRNSRENLDWAADEDRPMEPFGFFEEDCREDLRDVLSHRQRERLSDEFENTERDGWFQSRASYNRDGCHGGDREYFHGDDIRDDDNECFLEEERGHFRGDNRWNDDREGFHCGDAVDNHHGHQGSPSDINYTRGRGRGRGRSRGGYRGRSRGWFRGGFRGRGRSNWRGRGFNKRGQKDD